MSGSLSKLVVQSLTISDEGSYRCRVDYSQAPTMIETVRLSILVPPSPPVIYDDHNIPLSQIVGPFHLGSNITLKCITRGGRKSPGLSLFKFSILTFDESFDFYLSLN